MTVTTISVVDASSKTPPPQVLSAPAVLAYASGNSYEDYKEYEKARPDLAKKHWVIPTTLSCTEFGHCYDIEPGGGKNSNIGIFMHNARIVWKTQAIWGPQWLYTFASNVDAMIDAAEEHFGYVWGKDFYVLCAHPNTVHGRHLCQRDVCGFPMRRTRAVDGTQYLFAGTYDESIVEDYMLPHAEVATLHGKLRVEVELDADKGVWTPKSLPGSGVKLGGHNRRWRCELSVGEEHGDWSTKDLPFG